MISCDRSRRDLLRLATAGRQLCLLGRLLDRVDLDTLSAKLLAVVDQTLQPTIQEAVGTASQPSGGRGNLPNQPAHDPLACHIRTCGPITTDYS